jgi:hypothetical protein
MVDKDIIPLEKPATVGTVELVHGELSYARGELFLTREMGEKEAEVRLRRIETDLRIAELQKETACIQAASNENIAKTSAESKQQIVRTNTEAQKKIAAIPARHATIRHVITTLVVCGGMVLVYVKPAIGWPVVGLAGVLAGISVIDTIKKSIKK